MSQISPDLFPRITGAGDLISRAQIVGRPADVPMKPAIYGWWFRELPPRINASACLQVDGFTLLYIGIAPQKPVEGKTSTSNLRKRIRNHCRADASRSTLRLSLGCLLSDRLGIALTLGQDDRLTFTPKGEEALSAWMDKNAFVNWARHDTPWESESQILASGLSLPLNLDDNPNAAGRALLSGIRDQARAAARSQSQA